MAAAGSVPAQLRPPDDLRARWPRRRPPPTSAAALLCAACGCMQRMAGRRATSHQAPAALQAQPAVGQVAPPAALEVVAVGLGGRRPVPAQPLLCRRPLLGLSFLSLSSSSPSHRPNTNPPRPSLPRPPTASFSSPPEGWIARHQDSRQADSQLFACPVARRWNSRSPLASLRPPPRTALLSSQLAKDCIERSFLGCVLCGLLSSAARVASELPVGCS